MVLNVVFNCVFFFTKEEGTFLGKTKPAQTLLTGLSWVFTCARDPVSWQRSGLFAEWFFNGFQVSFCSLTACCRASRSVRSLDYGDEVPGARRMASHASPAWR